MNWAVFVGSLWLAIVLEACSDDRPEARSQSEGHQPHGRSGYVAGAAGVRLFYWLDGDGPDTVVVLHGGPGFNLEGLRPDLGQLAQKHTLLYFDQRGSGRSEMPDTLRLTAALMVEDLEALRRAFHLDRLTLLGHSWGGGLAVLYAARYPDEVRQLILVGPMAPRKHPYTDQFLANMTARQDSAEKAHMALLDSMWVAAPGQYSLCREGMRLFLRSVAATPEAAESHQRRPMLRNPGKPPVDRGAAAPGGCLDRRRRRPRWPLRLAASRPAGLGSYSGGTRGQGPAPADRE